MADERKQKNTAVTKMKLIRTHTHVSDAKAVVNKVKQGNYKDSNVIVGIHNELNQPRRPFNTISLLYLSIKNATSSNLAGSISLTKLCTHRVLVAFKMFKNVRILRRFSAVKFPRYLIHCIYRHPMCNGGHQD